MCLQHPRLPPRPPLRGPPHLLLGGEGRLLRYELPHGVGARDLVHALARQHLAQVHDAMAMDRVPVGALVVPDADVDDVLPAGAGAGAGVAGPRGHLPPDLLRHDPLPVVLDLGGGQAVVAEVLEARGALGALDELLPEHAAQERGLRLREAEEGEVARHVHGRDLPAAGAAQGLGGPRTVRRGVLGARGRVRGRRRRGHVHEEGERAGARGRGVDGGRAEVAPREDAAFALGEARREEGGHGDVVLGPRGRRGGLEDREHAVAGVEGRVHDARAVVGPVTPERARHERCDGVPDAGAPARGELRGQRYLLRETQEGAEEGETCGLGGRQRA